MVLSILTPREQAVLHLRFGIGEVGDQRLDEVGKQYGLSQTQVFHIQVGALHKLRQRGPVPRPRIGV